MESSSIVFNTHNYVLYYNYREISYNLIEKSSNRHIEIMRYSTKLFRMYLSEQLKTLGRDKALAAAFAGLSNFARPLPCVI